MTYTSPNWTDPINWGIALGLLILLISQGWLLLRNSRLSTGRLLLRAALNGLLWLALVAHVLHIRWPVDRPATQALLVGEDVPASYAQTVQDSLHIRDRLTARTLKASYDSITLVGQAFPTETLAGLSQSVVRWVPYDVPGQLQDLRWKGIVRQGEMQHVTGRIQSPYRQLLRIRYGRQTLDSLLLVPGTNRVALRFPVFGRGRLQTELMLGEQPLDTVRFYSRSTTPLQITFLLDNPDFESKTLADWLGKQGHSVRVLTTLAKNVSNITGINRSPNEAGLKPDVVITDPANATNTLVRKAITNGKAVLFINLSNPPAEAAAINRALGTRWQVMKFLNQETVPVGANLTAHPYRFTNASNQFAIPSYPVAVQQIAGRVGMSLLNETFPLTLSGDSIAYSRIWSAIMARLQPAAKNNVLVDAPVFSGLLNVIYVNNPVVSGSSIQVGTDTMRLINSPLNRQSATGTILTQQTGWQPVQDSLAVWVENTDRASSIANRQVVSQFIMAHATYQTPRTGTSHQTHEPWPGWVWLVLFLICLTALWIEPKFA